MKRLLMHTGMIVLLASGLLSSLPALAAPEQKYVVKPVAQKKIKELPAGPLYWRVENFPTLTDAKAAVGPDGWNPASVRYETTTSLIAEVAGKVWVVTLGPKGASTPGGTKVAEIGPAASDHRIGVSAASQLWLRTAWIQDTGALPSGLRILLRDQRPAGPKDCRWRELCRRRAHHGWTCLRNDHGSLQRRQDGSECPDHVRGGCEQAVLVTSGVPLSDVMTRPEQLRDGTPRGPHLQRPI